MIDFNKKKVLLFDYDDTIRVTSKINYKNYKRTVFLMGYKPASYKEFLLKSGIPLHQIILSLHKKIDIKKFMEIYSSKKHIPKSDPNLVKLFEKIRQRFLLGVLSSRPEDVLKERLTEIGILDCFMIVRGYKKGDPLKPNPLLMRSVLKIFSVNVNEVVYFGDTQLDFLLAKNSGVDFVVVLNGLRKSKYFIDLGLPSDQIIENIFQIERLFIWK